MGFIRISFQASEALPTFDAFLHRFLTPDIDSDTFRTLECCTIAAETGDIDTDYCELMTDILMITIINVP